jgi:disulfide bond formation protein DsbB
MSISPRSIDRFGPKALLAFIVALVVASMAGALFFQHVLHFEPCPLCVLQRVAIIGAGVFAALGLFAAGVTGLLAATALSGLSALAGAGVAAWHSWIVMYPPESMSCGRPFEWFHEEFPLGTWLPKLFAGEGDCLKIDWSLFGLTIPNLALISFVVLLAAAALAARAAWARRR